MWIWKVGSKIFCDWRSDEWPYRCAHHIIGVHVRDGERIARYCRPHIPEGLTVIDRNQPTK
jgi:hypothetical protein